MFCRGVNNSEFLLIFTSHPFTGTLARVVMLDQGTRTAFRGTPKAFAYDDIAKELVLDIIQKGWFFDKYLPVERQILCLPLLHSEDIHAHRVASELVHRLSEGTDNPELVQMFKSSVSFLAEHTLVVEKFGRYPSRNSALVSQYLCVKVHAFSPLHT